MKDLRRCNCCVVFVGERKKSTSLQLLSVTSNLLLHICGYSLQLQILLSQMLSCFAPKIPSYHRLYKKMDDASPLPSTIEK